MAVASHQEQDLLLLCTKQICVARSFIDDQKCTKQKRMLWHGIFPESVNVNYT